MNGLPKRGRNFIVPVMTVTCLLNLACWTHAFQFDFGQRQDIVQMYLYRNQTEEAFRANLLARAEGKVELIASVCGIREDMQHKLQLAARSDVNRFMREVADVREKTRQFDLDNQNQMQEAWQIVMPLYQRSNSDLLNEDSLFMKLFPKVLTQEQEAAYKNHLAARQAQRRRASIRVLVVEIEKSMPLRSEQRDALVAALEEIPTPHAFTESRNAGLGYALLAKVKVDDVGLDEQQLAVFNLFRERYAGFAQGLQW